MEQSINKKKTRLRNSSTKIMYSTSERTEIVKYTDTTLVKIVRKLTDQMDAKMIHLRFLDRNEYYSGILCSIRNKKKGERQHIYIYRINRSKETYEEYLKEAQRIKELLKGRFNYLKVTSNFRYMN